MLPPIDRADVPLAPVIEEVTVTAVTPLTGGATRVCAAVTVDSANPIFAGHYPGLPVFPGVCQLECAHRTVLALARRKGVQPVLERIVTARFLRMVSPGDQLAIDTVITQDGPQWTAAAVLTGAMGRTATFALRYRLPGGES